MPERIMQEIVFVAAVVGSLGAPIAQAMMGQTGAYVAAALALGLWLSAAYAWLRT